MGRSEGVALAAGNLRLELSPSIGGSISSLLWSDGESSRQVLRKCNNLGENVLDAASFPLVPYVNRIRRGAFSFRGRDVRLQPNMAGDPSPLHGQGWLSPWDVRAATASTATLSFRHEPGEWPWAYEAAQTFDLDETGLSVRLDCRNLSDEPMPCGLGQHPYFDCGPQTRIDTKVEHVWTIDAQVLPVERIPASGRFDLSGGPVCGLGLDHGFGGWGGRARLTDPDWPFDLEMSSPTARFFQLYSPASGGIFVAEPVTHANAALNAPEAQWEELGLQVLDPGEELHLVMRLDVIAKHGSG